MASRRPRGRPKKTDPSSDINKTVTESESQEGVVESSSESEVTEPVQSVTTSDESTTDSDELLDITSTVEPVTTADETESVTTSDESATVEPTQSFEYVRRDHVLVCPACNKQAASGLDRQPICSSTQHPACPRRTNNG